MVLSLLAGLQGCADSRYLVDSIQARQFRFADGNKAIYYQIEKTGASHSDEGQVDNMLFVISGSDCISMGPFLPQYFTGFGEESGATRILILHKRHILATSDGRHCSDAFVRDDHFSRWQQDQLEFINAQLLALKKSGVTVKRIILLGISEGAELAPVLAQNLPVTHLVLLSHSGLNGLDAYRELARQHAYMQEGWAQLQTALKWQPDNIDESRVHERSWRYWSEIATVHQQDNLLRLNLPVFLAYGEADPVIVPAALENLQQSFNAAGKNMRISRFPDADHGLRSLSRNYLPDFMHQVENWLMETSP